MRLTITESPSETHKGKIHFLFFSLHKNSEVRTKKIIISELTRVIPIKKESRAVFLKNEIYFIKTASKNKLANIKTIASITKKIPFSFFIELKIRNYLNTFP